MSKRSRIILCILVLLTGLFNSVVAYAISSIGQRFTVPAMAAAAALMVPALICIVWLSVRPTRAALGLAGGLALVNVLTSMSIGALFFLGAWNPGDGERALKAAGFLVLPNLIVAIIAIAMAFRQFGGRALGPLAAGFGGALALDAAAGVLAMILSTMVSMGATFQWGAMDRGIAEAVTHVQACAFQYAERNPEKGYPATIEEMAAGVPTCMDADWLKKAKAMGVRYTADAQVGGGPVRSFGIQAKVSTMDGDDIYASADTGGTFNVFTPGEPRDSIARPTGNERAMWRLEAVRNCALLNRNIGKPDPFPANMQELWRIGEKRDLDKSFLGCDRFGDVNTAEGVDALTYEGQRITYRSQGDAFTIEMRPITYGVTANNSYLVHDTGAVYRTTSDRAATTSDPVIPVCEWADSVTTTVTRCVRFARPKLDVGLVDFLHEAEAGPRDVVTLRARDPQDSSRAPNPSLWISLACGIDSAQVEIMQAPPVRRSRLEERCHVSNLEFTKTQLPVLLFFRDSLGAIAWRLDTVTVRR
jgi:hypothetical protein